MGQSGLMVFNFAMSMQSLQNCNNVMGQSALMVFNSAMSMQSLQRLLQEGVAMQEGISPLLCLVPFSIFLHAYCRVGNVVPCYGIWRFGICISLISFSWEVSIASDSLCACISPFHGQVALFMGG